MNSKPMLVVVALGVLLTVAVGWRLVQDRAEQAETPPPPMPEQTTPPEPTVQQGAPAAPAPVPEPLEEGAAARAAITELRAQPGGPDLDAAFGRAWRLQQQGRLVDAHLLYFFAAREGSVPAAVALAAMYDPVDFDPAASALDQPDATQAHKWYRRAAAEGDVAAKARLEALRRWVEAAAEAGDIEARSLLMRW
jgi:TPR repeat protein